MRAYGTPGPGPWITLYANTRAHVDRDRRPRVRHRGLRRSARPRRQRPALARQTRPPTSTTDCTTSPAIPRAMTRDEPTCMPATSPPHSWCLARARARETSGRALAALLVAGELAGCAGIANPYQTNGTATQHDFHPADDDARRRRRSLAQRTNGPTLPASRDRPRQRRRRADEPQAALTRYALLYINWTAGHAASDQRGSPRSHSGKRERRRSKPPPASSAIPS